jgi:hypothetical protein
MTKVAVNNDRCTCGWRFVRCGQSGAVQACTCAHRISRGTSDGAGAGTQTQVLLDAAAVIATVDITNTMVERSRM